MTASFADCLVMANTDAQVLDALKDQRDALITQLSKVSKWKVGEKEVERTNLERRLTSVKGLIAEYEQKANGSRSIEIGNFKFQ